MSMCPDTTPAAQKCAVCQTEISATEKPYADIPRQADRPLGPEMEYTVTQHWIESVCSADCLDEYTTTESASCAVMNA